MEHAYVSTVRLEGHPGCEELERKANTGLLRMKETSLQNTMMPYFSIFQMGPRNSLHQTPTRSLDFRMSFVRTIVCRPRTRANLQRRS